MQTYLTYSLKSKLITEAITSVVDAMLLSAKNVRNCVIFQINNILTAYNYSKESQLYILTDPSRLHANQIQAITLINQVIPEFNKKRSR